MVAHARAESPRECCGLLAGRVAGGVGRVTDHFPLVNELARPDRFRSAPAGMFAAVKAMRAAGTDVLAVYHSHPTSPPVPSRHDVAENYSDRVVTLIVGLAGPEPEVRGWWIAGGDVREAGYDLL